MGHWKKGCYQIIGFPKGWDENRKRGRGRGRGNSSTRGGKGGYGRGNTSSSGSPPAARANAVQEGTNSSSGSASSSQTNPTQGPVGVSTKQAQQIIDILKPRLEGDEFDAWHGGDLVGVYEEIQGEQAGGDEPAPSGSPQHPANGASGQPIGKPVPAGRPTPTATPQDIAAAASGLDAGFPAGEKQDTTSGSPTRQGTTSRNQHHPTASGQPHFSSKQQATQLEDKGAKE
ncbi:GPI-anchored CFEM domain protein A-like [Chenopodium quinoa]|uniref:GPI-anchored CFEM domain protein A-like n=1 Tax=Chenopodium quinoa TaxID=63459 RepID=UPI000B787DE5|nr:GPI-anchored CFEM domain protein A-like [Chenopodium quinoa]